MKQAHIFISGFVQGIGFRAFVKKNAEKLHVTGWVRNTKDNRVEAVFQGDRKNVKTLITICNKGTWLSEVKEVDEMWEDHTEKFTDFSIRHEA